MRFASAYEPGEFETDIYAAWEAEGVFAPREVEADAVELNEEDGKRVKQEKVETYSLVMPPPNANGNLHIGHGLTIALEDSLARYYRLKGRRTWYVPGADHAGFETWVVYERQLEKEGRSRFDYLREQLYSQVWNFVQEQRGNMELQLRALGASCSWKDLTFTLDENVVRRVYATFERMWKDGMVYRGEKLVNFCTKHQTAFADIEVEHEEEEGMLWDIAYPIVEMADNGSSSASAGALHGCRTGSTARSATPASLNTIHSKQSEPSMADEMTEIVISTTRPETLFGDMAVAVNPADERYKGLVGGRVQLPLTRREIPVIADEHAQMEYGTGAVKITPAHDYDDFEVGERHDLEKLSVIGADGRMLPVCGEEYAGLSTAECRKKVLADLKEKGLLRGEKKITHAVAHCYKCGTVIEPMLREQWFVDTKRLAKVAIEHLEKGEIKFYPENKGKVLINYLKGLKDWNISRQIPWGIAIPMFRLADDFVDNGSSSASADALLPRRTESTARSATPASLNMNRSRQNPGAVAKPSVEGVPEWIFDTRVDLHEIEVGGYRYVRDEDTFDTWFSSSHWPIVCTDWEDWGEIANNGSSSASVDARFARRTGSAPRSSAPASLNMTHSEKPMRNAFNTPFYPLNVMETGADILFAWVARMVMMGLYVTGEVPFREVYLHGLVLDAHGQKMSKSKGNVINPMELVTKYGSDAFRLGILRGRSAGMNQAFSENSVVSGRNLCNKLWNVSRFVQEIVDNTPVKVEDVGEVRKGKFYGYSTENMGEDWICRELDECRGKLEGMMKEYRFAEAVELLYSTIWDKYADWFLESQKLYRDVELLQMTLEMILKMLHPFAPFVTEAIWQNLSWTGGMLINQKWPERPVYDPISAENFERLMVIVQEVRGTLQRLPGGKKWVLLYGDDSLVEDNAELVKFLTKAAGVKSCEGQPRGLRIALANTELYLDVPEKVVVEYRATLEKRILEVGRELDGLNARMMNPRYVEKAPAKLVKETQDAIAEKEGLIERLKRELTVI